MIKEVVRTLIDIQSREDLIAAREAILGGRMLPFVIEGSDESEKLTNLLAALHVLDSVQQGVDFDVALRQYIAQVRGTHR